MGFDMVWKLMGAPHQNICAWLIFISTHKGFLAITINFLSCERIWSKRLTKRAPELILTPEFGDDIALDDEVTGRIEDGSTKDGRKSRLHLSPFLFI
mmetsp:Transcript_38995/g.79511  ORF Transcript_38995/g.79511 Transcript_38995/m.79511 type:complete len:97 (-) Transcript_38995:45-335(-)